MRSERSRHGAAIMTADGYRVTPVFKAKRWRSIADSPGKFYVRLRPPCRGLKLKISVLLMDRTARCRC